MSTSATGIWIICVVGVIGLIAAVVMVRLAGRRPYSEPPSIEEEAAAHDGRQPRSAGNPMDL
jgi:hypothetical protein